MENAVCSTRTNFGGRMKMKALSSLLMLDSSWQCKFVRPEPIFDAE
jgi:hypothetical protein